MNVYEIRVGGNAPATAHGLYHRSGHTPTEAKTKLAYTFRSQGWAKKISIKKLISWMRATKI